MKFLKDKNNIIIITMFLILLPFWLFKFRTISMDYDLGNFMLRAEDIASGNLFLKGWFLTGLLFALDLIYYTVGFIFFGLTTKAYVVSATAIYMTFLMVGTMLLENKKSNWKEALIFLLLVGFPNSLTARNYLTHTVTITLGILGLYFLNQFLESENDKKYCIFSFLSFSVGVFSDPIVVIVTILPIFIYSSYVLIDNYLKDETYKLSKKHKQIILLSSSSILLGIFLEKIYFLIGKASKNDYLSFRNINTLESFLFHKIPLYIESIMKISDTYFFSERIISSSHLGTGLRILILFMGIYFIIKNIKLWINHKENDYISTILGMGFISASLVFLLSDNVFRLVHSRYLNFYVVFFAIIIIRNNRNLILNSSREGKKISFILLIVSILNINYKNIEFTTRPSIDEYDKIIEILKENNLKQGFSNFFHASILTVKSRGEIRVLSVIPNQVFLEKWLFSDPKPINYNSNYQISNWNWDTKLEWYKKATNFIILEEKDEFGINKKVVLQNFGEPIKKISIPDSNKIIFIYEKDISKFIDFKQKSIVQEQEEILKGGQG